MAQPKVDDVSEDQLLKDVQSMVDCLKDAKFYGPVYAMLPGRGFVDMTSDNVDSELLELRESVINYWKSEEQMFNKF